MRLCASNGLEMSDTGMTFEVSDDSAQHLRWDREVLVYSVVTTAPAPRT